MQRRYDLLALALEGRASLQDEEAQGPHRRTRRQPGVVLSSLMAWRTVRPYRTAGTPSNASEQDSHDVACVTANRYITTLLRGLSSRFPSCDSSLRDSTPITFLPAQTLLHDPLICDATNDRTPNVAFCKPPPMAKRMHVNLGHPHLPSDLKCERKTCPEHLRHGLPVAHTPKSCGWVTYTRLVSNDAHSESLRALHGCVDKQRVRAALVIVTD